MERNAKNNGGMHIIFSLVKLSTAYLLNCESNPECQAMSAIVFISRLPGNFINNDV